MSVEVRSSRRRFLAAILGLGLFTFARPSRGWAALAERRRYSSLSSKLVNLLRHKESARIIGLEYLRSTPRESDAQTLTDLISAGFVGSQKNRCEVDAARLRELLRLQMRQDFEEGRIIRLRGWIVSVTEARLCALAALV